MNKLLFLSLISFSFLISSCTRVRKSEPHADIFAAENLRGCFLLYNVNAAKLEKKIGTTCDERFPASSTFKVPLSVMAFDAGILKDENEVYKWDGNKGMFGMWNKDQTAKSWMKFSVVWFSQKLTPKLGEEKIQKYLNDFNYGNKNIHQGLTTAWLNPAHRPEEALSISANEQLEFMKNLWAGKLPASVRSQEITRKIMYLETLSSGYRFSGKTGTNFFDLEKTHHLGWFIGELEKEGQQYIVVTNLADLKPFKDKEFGGFRARELTKVLFADFIQK